MKKFLYGFAFAFTFLLINKLDTNAQGVATWTYDNYNSTTYAYNEGSIFMVRNSSDSTYYNVWSTSPSPLYYYSIENGHQSNVFSQSSPYSSYSLNGVTYYMFSLGIRTTSGHIVFLCPVFNSINDYTPPINYDSNLNLNTTDYFKVSPFRLLSKDYIYYEFDIRSKNSLIGGQALVQVIGDKGTWKNRHYGIFSNQSGTVAIDDYASVNSVFYVTLTPIGSNNDYGQSIIYKYRLTQDGIISFYDEPIDTPKGLNVNINNNYIPVTQINKNRAFVTNIDYSTITYNSMNVEYSSTWDVYYSPNISISNDNISIQNITDSYNTYNYVTNNYNELTYGLGLNFDFGDNDISDDGNVIDTLDNIKLLLSFLPWLLGLFSFIPSTFVTIILGGFAIILVVVVVKIFK